MKLSQLEGDLARLLTPFREHRAMLILNSIWAYKIEQMMIKAIKREDTHEVARMDGARQMVHVLNKALHSQNKTQKAESPNPLSED